MNSKDGSSFRDSALNFNGDDEERQQLLEGPGKLGEIDPIGSEVDHEKGELGKRKESTRSSLQEIDRIRSELDQGKEEWCKLKDSTRDSFGEEERKQLPEAQRKVCEIGIKSELDQVKEELRNSKKSNASRSLPQDTYSMMMIPFSGARVTVFSSFIFLFQVGFLALIIVDFSDGPAFVPMFNPPPDVSPEVRASQFFAIIIALCTQEDTIESITILLSLFSTERWSEFYTQFQRRECRTREEPVMLQRLRCCCFWSSWSCFGLCMIMTPRQVYYASNGLRLTQGLLALVVSMIIIIQSYSIIDLFKDFAAMAFISTLDNVAYSLANHGFFGTVLSSNAGKVISAELPEMTRRERIVRGYILLFLYAGMLGGWAFVVQQQQTGEWLPKRVDVQFGDSEDFAVQAYSGVYERIARHTITGGRFIYRRKGRNPEEDRGGHFAYCADSKRWMFTTGYYWGVAEEFTGKIMCSPNPKAVSSSTDSYDLTTVPTTGWSVSNGLAMVPLNYLSIVSNDCSHDGECGLETTWPKRSGSCNEESSRCNCSDGFYGERCQFLGPCQALEVLDNNTEFEGFPSSFSVVESVTFYGQPVYANYKDVNDYDVVVFAGRRWVMMKKSHVFDNLSDFYRDSYRNDFDLDSFRNSSTFVGDMFHVAMRNTEVLYSVQFVSEPTIGGTPNGLQWYKRLSRDPTGHAAERIGTTFTCSSYGFKYCQVEAPSRIGDGRCHLGEYNTEQCGWDGGDCVEFNGLYPNCTVEYPSMIGDGWCDIGEYNTEQCGWDGGDCVEFNRLYPNCTVDNPSWIGDGRCHAGEYHTEQCGWDGGDCVVEGYPDCHVDYSSFIGDGECLGGTYNTEECGWDGGDCVEFNRLYPNCTVYFPYEIGNGLCYEGYNTEECGYDGGNCCQESCIPGEGSWQKCDGPWDHCVDPKYSQRN